MNKHPLLLSKNKTGLVVVDLQDKFAPAIAAFDEIVENALKLVLSFQMFDMPVIVTEQYPQGLGNTVDKIRSQFKFIEIIEKTEFACTSVPKFWTQLQQKEIDTVVICGVETHVCINQTVLGLLQQGIKVHVLVDAVGSRFLVDHNAALRKMEVAGAVLSTTEMCLFELVERAGTESFKNISRMVRNRAAKPPAVS